MSGHQGRWNDSDVVAQFAQKGTADCFRSETRFLEEIAGDIASVLDIGCAAGRLIELLRRYGVDPDFTGVDLSAASLARARPAFPQARFIEVDALELELDGTFDLVNATGVCQHEPRFEELIRRMVAWSARFVLFDVKFAAIERHLIDMDRAYCGSAANRLYYILLAPRLFCHDLQGVAGIKRISIFGYETPLNARTVLPEGIGPVVSAGILLEKGEEGGRAASLSVELPRMLHPVLDPIT